ncbi:ATP-binding cassette domain-containing protein [Shouchella shacheensis]|uniref:ATP-binding cassette domain-containing protein n=1 Tax=Shouchella shacheensis TaxID=1649580 RepID=UPI00073FC4DA|nr:ATP-binding cassette domain-containing protein [Shouchella shacheensis]
MDISFKQVTHLYGSQKRENKKGLEDITVSVPSGAFVAIVGKTGSGKSTLSQHLNGLLVPTSGEIQVGPHHIRPGGEGVDLHRLRQQVGFLFQYPEHQLFEETVKKDLLFGPLAFGQTKEEAASSVEAAINAAQLDRSLLERSPFHLSGGQKRRVAIASILAQNPKVLVLDEPVAALDPKGRSEILKMLHNFHQSKATTTWLVTHHMEDVVKYADYVLVMKAGRLLRFGTAEDVLTSSTIIDEAGLVLPDTLRLLDGFVKRFRFGPPPFILDREKACEWIAGKLLRRAGEKNEH